MMARGAWVQVVICSLIQRGRIDKSDLTLWIGRGTWERNRRNRYWVSDLATGERWTVYAMLAINSCVWGVWAWLSALSQDAMLEVDVCSWANGMTWLWRRRRALYRSRRPLVVSVRAWEHTCTHVIKCDSECFFLDWLVGRHLIVMMTAASSSGAQLRGEIFFLQP